MLSMFLLIKYINLKLVSKSLDMLSKGVNLGTFKLMRVSRYPECTVGG